MTRDCPRAVSNWLATSDYATGAAVGYHWQTVTIPGDPESHYEVTLNYPFTETVRDDGTMYFGLRSKTQII